MITISSFWGSNRFWLRFHWVVTAQVSLLLQNLTDMIHTNAKDSCDNLYRAILNWCQFSRSEKAERSEADAITRRTLFDIRDINSKFFGNQNLTISYLTLSWDSILRRKMNFFPLPPAAWMRVFQVNLWYQYQEIFIFSSSIWFLFFRSSQLAVIRIANE